MRTARRSTMQIQTDAFRARVLAMESTSTTLLSATYAEVLKNLEPRILAIAEQIAEARANGEEPNISWLFQQERYEELRRQVIELMDRYGQTAKVVTTEAQKVIVRESLVHAGQMLLPVSGGDGGEIAQLVRGWAAVPDDAIVQMVGALQDGSPLDQAIRSYADDAADDVQKALTRGLALGDSSLATAKIVENALSITRARAESLVRTETLRAARAATMAAYEASGVVTKVRWSAALSERTCGFCLSRHGRLYPLGTVMASHPCCRCSWSPYNPKWSDPWQSGEDWLKEQPLAVQETILGRLGAADFNAGNVRLSDFERTSFDKDWGPQGRFGGIGWARQKATKDGRQPDAWAEAPPRKVAIKRKAKAPSTKQSRIKNMPALGPSTPFTAEELAANERRRQQLLSEPMVEFLLDV